MLLIIILIVLVFGGLPVHSYSQNWGYYPSGGLGILLFILVVLALMGRL